MDKEVSPSSFPERCFGVRPEMEGTRVAAFCLGLTM